MLKQRVITAIALLLGIGGPVFLLSLDGFTVLALAVFMIAAWEWAGLCDWKAPAVRIGYAVFVGALLVAGVYFFEMLTVQNHAGLKVLFTMAGVWWAVALLWIQAYPSSVALWGAQWSRALIGLLVLLPCCFALIWMRVQGPYVWLVLYLVILVAVADVGAYFFGKAFGNKKMAPQVSPGKSWAGLFGGLFCAVLFAVLIFKLFDHLIPISATQCVVISAMAALSSVIGDLLESMLKRHSGIKDSSNILPGHGGVLDRMDGWTAAAPIFALCLLSVGWQI